MKTWKDFIPVPNSWLNFGGNQNSIYRTHAGYLASVLKNTKSLIENRRKEIKYDDLDWTDSEELKRDGFIYPDLARIETIDDPFESHANPSSGYVKIPSRVVNGRIQYPKSIAGHEFGHVRDFILNKNSPIKFEDFFGRSGTLDSSIESLTNGNSSAKAPLLREEEVAWDMVPIGYDRKFRDLALSNYRTGIARRWASMALQRLENDGLITTKDFHDAHESRVKITDEELKWLPDFWRTNSYNNAINYLNGLN